MSQRLDHNLLASDGMRGFAAVHQYLSRCGLPMPLIDLVYLRVSQINGCAYCIDQHSRDLLKGGMSTNKLALVPVWFEAESLFSPQEKAALAWTESVTLVSQTHVPDADFAAVSAQFDQKQLADLTIAISLMNAYNRMAISFRKTPVGAKL